MKSDNDSSKDKKEDPYEYLMSYENREREQIRNLTPGAIYKIQLDNTHPLGFGLPEYYYSLKLNDDIYELFSDDDGWNVGTIKKDGYVSGFVGYE